MDSKVISVFLLGVFFVGTVLAVPYMEALTDNNDVDAYVPAETYDDQGVGSYFTFPQKRNCKRRGQKCDYWGEGEQCCNGQCKCSWGQNCKCRPGLFQAWG